MIDRKYSNSAFVALRFTEKPGVDFCSAWPYRHPDMPSEEGRILVSTAAEIDRAIADQLDDAKSTVPGRVGLLLSGGMDSGILASYLPGADAYTFRFLGGEYQKEELRRAEIFAERNGMTLHYVDIGWEQVREALPAVMRSKGGPVHSIEPQIYLAAQQAKADGVGLMIIGDASDYVFGGMDKLLSKDWTYDEFVRRYIYVDPFEVLREPVSMDYVFERYRTAGAGSERSVGAENAGAADGIDVPEILRTLAAQESYGSYNNAFEAAEMPY
ncbi:MAG: asparagine synthase, partial [Lachnospiraceae bacterium]|nr:asparagine synthase [Lachnospiraceae bacterium]